MQTIQMLRFFQSFIFLPFHEHVLNITIPIKSLSAQGSFLKSWSVGVGVL